MAEILNFSRIENKKRVIATKKFIKKKQQVIDVSKIENFGNLKE